MIACVLNSCVERVLSDVLKVLQNVPNLLPRHRVQVRLAGTVHALRLRQAVVHAHRKGARRFSDDFF
jgi:hypothetical protein